jgi:hypothetical protein
MAAKFKMVVKINFSYKIYKNIFFSSLLTFCRKFMELKTSKVQIGGFIHYDQIRPRRSF